MRKLHKFSLREEVSQAPKDPNGKKERKKESKERKTKKKLGYKNSVRTPTHTHTHTRTHTTPQGRALPQHLSHANERYAKKIHDGGN